MRAILAVSTLAFLLAPKLARAADPTTAECLAANESSIKLRSDHKLVQARAQLLVCAASSCPEQVRAVCTAHVAQVTAAIPTVVFQASSPAGTELTDVKVTMDGALLASGLQGTALTIDPGQHEFTFETPGQPAVTKTLVIHEGEKDRREKVVIGTEAPPVPPPVTQGPPAAAGTPIPAPPPSPSSGVTPSTPPVADDADGSDARSAWRRRGFITGGVGLAAGVAGGVFAGLAATAWSNAQSECPSHQGCSDQAQHDRSNALTWATASTVTMIVGGVLVATGITFVLAAPSAGDATPPAVSVGVSPVGAEIAGVF